jgi:hypothetical protein
VTGRVYGKPVIIALAMLIKFLSARMAGFSSTPKEGSLMKYLSGNKCIAFRRAELSGLVNTKQDGFIIAKGNSWIFDADAHGGNMGVRQRRLTRAAEKT